MKPAIVLGLTGALTLAALTVSDARSRRAPGMLAEGEVIAGAAATGGYYAPASGYFIYDPNTRHVPEVDGMPPFVPKYKADPGLWGGYYGYGYGFSGRDNNYNEQSRVRHLRGHE